MSNSNAVLKARYDAIMALEEAKADLALEIKSMYKDAKDEEKLDVKALKGGGSKLPESDRQAVAAYLQLVPPVK